MAKKIILKNACIVSTKQIIDCGWLTIIDNKIVEIQSGTYKNINNDETSIVIDCQNKRVIPGFIDIHVHGGYGYSFIDETKSLKESLDGFAKSVLKEGVTKFCCATVTASKTVLDSFFQQLGSYMNEQQDKKQAKVLGAYLEGPFISLKYKGAHDSNLLVEPNIEWVDQWQKLSNNNLKVVTFAPECDKSFDLPTNNFTTSLLNKNIIASAGHSDASFSQIAKTVEYGLKHVTHLYNAMSKFDHRNPGCVPAILANKNIIAELICDGVHVNLDIIKLTYNIKTADNIIMVSDAISAKGCKDGDYQLGTLAIVKNSNVATLKDDRNAISGSVATMIDGFKNLLKVTNNNWQDCIKMSSYNSAKQLKIDDITGDIAEDKLADLIVLDENNDIYLTIVEGNIAFENK